MVLPQFHSRTAFPDSLGMKLVVREQDWYCLTSEGLSGMNNPHLFHELSGVYMYMYVCIIYTHGLFYMHVCVNVHAHAYMYVARGKPSTSCIFYNFKRAIESSENSAPVSPLWYGPVFSLQCD